MPRRRGKDAGAEAPSAGAETVADEPPAAEASAKMRTTPKLEFEAVPAAAPGSDTSTGWAELVTRQHGERHAVPKPEVALPETAPTQAPDPVPAPALRTAAAEETSPSRIAAMADAAVGRIDRRIDSLREEVAATSSTIRDRLQGLTEEIAPRVGEVESELESSIAVLFEQIGRLDDKLANAEGRLADEVAALRSGIESLQSTFGTALAQPESDVAGPTQEAPPGAPAAAAAEPGSSPPARGTLALNSARFEDLRALGLSVTQAARVIAYRDTHGGFAELDQLREIRGLSAEDLQLLTEHSTL